jgi:hypothetical protein
MSSADREKKRTDRCCEAASSLSHLSQWCGQTSAHWSSQQKLNKLSASSLRALHPQQHQRLSEDEQNTFRNLSIFHRMPRAVDHLSAVQDGSSFRLSLCLTPLLENQDKVEICKKHFDVLSLSSSSSSCVLMSSNLISGLS